MKRFNYISSLVLMTMIFMASCAEKERIFPEFETLEKGAFARVVGTINGPYGQNFNYFDVPGSNVNMEVEFYDENQGKNVESFTIEVAHAPTNKKAQIAQTTSANFGTSVNGLPNAKFNFTFQQVLTTLGLSFDQIAGGQRFVFNSTIKMKDGRVFNSANSAAALDLPAFNNISRQFNINIICPSNLAGTYTSTTTGTSTDGCCPEVTTVESIVTLTAGSAAGTYTISDFSAGMYKKWYEVYDINDAYLAEKDRTKNKTIGTITDACGNISGGWEEPFGEDMTITGMTIPSENKITYQWENGYGDKATVTLTKQ